MGGVYGAIPAVQNPKPRINPLMAPQPGREHDHAGDDAERLDERRVRELVEAAGRGRQPDAVEHDRLLKAAGGGDAGARDALTTAHLDWVVSAARERADRGLSQSDLFQEGTIGLMLAIERYGSAGHGDFEAFARRQVADSMDRALGDEEKVVRDGQLLVQAARDYSEAQMNLRRELGRSGTDAELAAKLEWSVKRTQEIGLMVEDARRRHDEELLQYLVADDVDLDSLIDERDAGDGG
jgi:DNA-directed RNA polymerase sigma subunit (sigma70/sigma32)